MGKCPEAGAWSSSQARQEGGVDEGDSQVTVVSLGDSLGQHHLPGVSTCLAAPVSRASCWQPLGQEQAGHVSTIGHLGHGVREA